MGREPCCFGQVVYQVLDIFPAQKLHFNEVIQIPILHFISLFVFICYSVLI